jgi:hypothetical protein
MAELVANCPRCGTRQITFDAIETWPTITKYDWQRWYEAFSICRNCNRSTVFVIAQSEYEERKFLAQNSPLKFTDSLNNHFRVESFINLTDGARAQAPEFTDPKVAAAFNEAAACMTVRAWNAAAAMLRLAIDLATKPLLPSEPTPGLKHRTRRDLGLRLEWLINNGKLPGELRLLSDCIRQDGNDGAHDGTLEKKDAEELMDFAEAMFERLYTEPERLRLAVERRNKRRGSE